MTIAVAGFVLGILSAFWPHRSIGLYQWMMERFNWRVAPIDEPKEIRNTRTFGVWLILLGVSLAAVTLIKY